MEIANPCNAATALEHINLWVEQEWKISMNCKETEKMIPVFLQDDLDNRELEQFIEHIKDCPECIEELSIQFLVSEGLERLEAGNNFNLVHALESRIKASEHEIKVHNALKYTLICMEAAVAAAIVIALVVVFKF